MKPESLVIADQHAAVNTFPGLVHTARHTTKAGNTGSRKGIHFRRQPPKVGPMIAVKSYQGSRIGRCGWIASFLRIITETYLVVWFSFEGCKSLCLFCTLKTK